LAETLFQIEDALILWLYRQTGDSPLVVVDHSCKGDLHVELNSPENLHNFRFIVIIQRDAFPPFPIISQELLKLLVLLFFVSLERRISVVDEALAFCSLVVTAREIAVGFGRG